MADLSLKINANFDQAQKAFNDLAKESEEAGIALKNFAKNYNDESAEKFIQKQKLAAAAITATKGPIAALEASTKAYEREIEKLIKSGMNPENEAIKKLRLEYTNLKSQQDTNVKSTASLKDQITGMVPAIGGAIAAYKAMSSAINAARQFVNESIEAYKKSEEANARLESVLSATGAAAWTTSGQLQDFAKELSASSGKSQQDIQDMQSVLLGFRSITGDVFNSATNAIVQMSGVMGGDMKAAANSFGKALDTPIEGMASLSRYGFVFTEQEKEMVKSLEEAGKHQEAQKIILDAMEGSFGNAANAVNNAAKAQNDYSSAMAAMKIAVGEAAAPVDNFVKQTLTYFITEITKAVALTNDYKSAMSRLKDDSYAEGETGEYQKLNDELAVYAKKLDQANKTRISAEERGRSTAAVDNEIASINAAISATQKEIDSIEARRKAAQDAAAEAAAIAAVTEKNEAAAAEARNTALKEAEAANKALKAQALKYAQALEDLKVKTDENKNDARQLLELQLAREEASIRASKADTAAKDAAIAGLRELYAEKLKEADANFEGEQDKEKIKAQQALFKLLKDQQKQFLEAQREADKLDLGKQAEFIKEKTAVLLEANQVEQDALNAQAAGFKALADEAEAAGNEERLLKMQEQQALVAEQLRINEDEKIAIQEESSKKLLEIENETAKEREKIKNAELALASQIAGDMAQLLDQYGKENKAALVAAKMIGLAQIGMNTAIAISQAIARYGPPPSPLGIIGIASATATGAMATASLIASAVKGAETGGSFIADGPPGVDTNLLRVNNGEQIDVTPAGQVGRQGSGSSLEPGYTVESMKEMICEIVNWGFRRGIIYALPRGNI